MRKSDLLKVFGTGSAIAELFKPFNGDRPLSRASISEWGDAIPELREFQLRKLFPDIDERIAKARRRNGHTKAA
jgi:hypothetical protein